MGKQFTITLPDDLAQLVQEQADGGAYASVDELMGDLVRELVAREQDGSQPEAWVRTVGVARLQEHQSDPSGIMTLAEVDAMLEKASGSSAPRV